MRREILKIMVIILPLICVVYWNCSKKEELVSKPRLFITVVDETGKGVEGASVHLYKNEQDPGLLKTTDSSGIVLFDSLETELYYWHAEKECKTNRNSQVSLNRPLMPGVVLYGYSILAETGILKIINTSAASYNVTDSLSWNIVLNDTPFITYPLVGAYTVYFEKISMPGAVRDTTIQMQCGDTTQLILPF